MSVSSRRSVVGNSLYFFLLRSAMLWMEKGLFGNGASSKGCISSDAKDLRDHARESEEQSPTIL